MSKAPQSQELFIDGPVGRLEAILEQPTSAVPVGSVVVLHPHPQHGGTLHNKVAHTLARTFVRLGFAALRFNFRGTEQSEGSYDDGNGELDDALAAIDWIRVRDRAVPLWVAGFSFGAAIGVRAAVEHAVDGLITVAPAVSRFPTGTHVQPECPWLLIQGDQDELVDVEDTIEWINGLDPGPELHIVPGAEHFFHGRLIELREVVTEFVQESSA